jgi:hypothetical protein
MIMMMLDDDDDDDDGMLHVLSCSTCYDGDAMLLDDAACTCSG